MSQFKGTKGKWALGGISGRMIKSTLPTEFGFIADVDTKANAILISKAPEMLEALSKVNEFIKENSDKNYMVKLLDRELPGLNELIESATNLK